MSLPTRNLPTKATRALRVFGLTVGVALVTLWLSACGIKTVDAPQLEQDIRLQLEKALQVNVLSVSCPEGERLEQGNRFECRLEAGTQSQKDLTVAVRVLKSGSLRIVEVSQASDSSSGAAS